MAVLHNGCHQLLLNRRWLNSPSVSTLPYNSGVLVLRVVLPPEVNRGNFEQQGNFEHQLQKNKNIPNFPVVDDILLR